MFQKALFLLILATSSSIEATAFVASHRRPLSTSLLLLQPKAAPGKRNKVPSTRLFATVDQLAKTRDETGIETKPLHDATIEKQSRAITSTDVDVEKLRAMAAKYRAEAAALEAERAQETALATQHAFAKFDRDNDGKITLSELKEGLEQQLKTELPQERAEALMQKFDDSGDGALQLEEFVGIERFKIALSELARDEQRRAKKLERIAKLEEEAYKEVSEILNDKPPTSADKLLSVIPYIFPLLDTLPYASYLVLNNPDNPFAQLITSAYFIYRSVPLSGFIAALSLTFLSGIPSINRLIRFNMLQAIYLDIALFVPGALSLLVGGLSQLTGQTVPLEAASAASNVLFVTSLAMILYAGTSSLTGQEPDKIPVVSDTVKRLLPSVDMLKDWIKEEKEKDDDSKIR